MERSSSERCSYTGRLASCYGSIDPRQWVHTASLWATVLPLGYCGGPRLLFVHHPPDYFDLSEILLAEAACYQIMEIDVHGRHRSLISPRIGNYRIL